MKGVQGKLQRYHTSLALSTREIWSRVVRSRTLHPIIVDGLGDDRSGVFSRPDSIITVSLSPMYIPLTNSLINCYNAPLYFHCISVYLNGALQNL